MNIDDFQKMAQKDINSFFVWWRAQHTKDPERFPLELEEAQWWEMLMTGAHGSEKSPEN